jgi:hypothetical protein
MQHLNSDIENLELEHRRVSISHQVITRNCDAFDPPIDAAASIGVCRAGPPVEAALFLFLVTWDEPAPFRVARCDQPKSLRGL